MLVAGDLAVVSRDSDVTQPATKRVCRKGPSKSAARLEPPIGSFAALCVEVERPWTQHVPYDYFIGAFPGGISPLWRFPLENPCANPVQALFETEKVLKKRLQRLLRPETATRG
jgi:hypothetical protein